MEERKRFKPVEKLEYKFTTRLVMYLAGIFRAIKDFPPKHYDAA